MTYEQLTEKLPMKTSLQIFTLAVVVATLWSSISHAADRTTLDDAWTRLSQGKAIAIMRHALAPGFSDPAHFEVDDCNTQRNLSEQGRAQARSAGDLFRGKGITEARVLTSQWCRCQDTATLLNIGTPVDLPALNSFFENRSAADEQTQNLLTAMPEWLQVDSEPTVLVTHQVNISALTGQFTDSGEILIIALENDKLDVLASVSTQH